MFGFSKPDHRSAIVLDVGSSSAGVAIVCLHPEGEIETVWRHREYALLRDDISSVTQIRQMKTVLTNAFLELTNNGLKTLRESGHTTKIDEIQCVVAAPWSHTITKTITLKDEHPFSVTDELIEELVESAKKQSKLVFATDKIARTLGLELTHGDVIGISLNGYNVIDPTEQKTRTISLSYIETAISSDITETVKDVVNKFFPKSKLTEYSFMYVFYLTLRNLRPNTSEICLIDVTGEATEVGIVRDDVLQHTTHTPNGIFSLARSIATATGVPKEEAYSYLKDDPDTLEERLPSKVKLKVNEMIQEYSQLVSDMFERTGDKLSIPKTIFLHTDPRTEDFFISQLEKATLKATGKAHTVHPVTAKVLGLDKYEDTALLISINFIAQKSEYMRILPKDV